MLSFMDSWFAMDFAGQKRAEKVFQMIIVLSTIIGFFVGYAFQLYSYSILTLAGGCLFSCLLCLFNWPCFRLKPLNWQKHLKEQAEDRKTK